MYVVFSLGPSTWPRNHANLLQASLAVVVVVWPSILMFSFITLHALGLHFTAKHLATRPKSSLLYKVIGEGSLI